MRFGPDTRLTHARLRRRDVRPRRRFHGTLYLKGGGDPTFGSQGFDHSAYGTRRDDAAARRQPDPRAGITSISGRIVGDESYFDSLRGTPRTATTRSSCVEGELSALAYNRGLANPQGSAFQRRPALFAAQQFASALRAAGVNVPSKTPVYTGETPAGAKQLAAVHSPRMSG